MNPVGHSPVLPLRVVLCGSCPYSPPMDSGQVVCNIRWAGDRDYRWLGYKSQDTVFIWVKSERVWWLITVWGMAGVLINHYLFHLFFGSLWWCLRVISCHGLSYWVFSVIGLLITSLFNSHPDSSHDTRVIDITYIIHIKTSPSLLTIITHVAHGDI